MASRTVTPVYMRVAVDVAGRIAKKELIIGQKIRGRTTLASEYSVSPETIRKAMKLLEEVNIVSVKHGNGIYVSSIDEAEKFIERYNIKASVNNLKEELIELMKKRDEIEQKMNDTMNNIVDYTSRFKNSGHITVHEYFLNCDSELGEKTIEELNFKKETGITLVGIKRDGAIILSPEENEIIKSQDKLLYVGSAVSSMKLGEYLRNVYMIDHL